MNRNNAKHALSGVMLIYAFLYCGFFLTVLFAESWVYGLLDYQQSMIGIGNQSGGAPPVAVWKYVALGLIATLALISFWSRTDVDRFQPLIQLMIYCKFISGLLMVGHYFLAGKITAFLLAGLSDWAMGAIAFIFLARAFPGSTSDFLRFKPLGAKLNGGK